MHPGHVGTFAFLFTVAMLGGAINSVAGGGGFLCFPALLFVGIPPIQANATNTIALWPGTVASVAAYRRELSRMREHIVPLIVTGCFGALIGALILLRTPQATFLSLVPWLLLAATVLFTVSPRISLFFRRLQADSARKHNNKALWVAAALQLLIAVYIGFFGAGAGILMLAMFSMLGIESIHTMNGMKTVLASVCNGIALITFIFHGAIIWPEGIVMTVGAAIGGYAGAHYAQKVDPRIIRGIVIATGAVLTVYFFWRAR
ncbi:MAG: sulfite exporter TauE/SafE family protein [Myxococcales bacterium]